MSELNIGRFSRKGQQLQKILIELANDNEFVALVADNAYSPSYNNLGVNFDNYSLINTRLYSQVYMPPTEEECVNVCVFYKRGKITNGNTFYKNSDIKIAIIVHRDLWNIQGSLRAYEIADRVDLLLNRKRVTESLSKDWFTSFDYTPTAEYYQVLELTYSNWN